jgi:hypothetical protein
MPGRSAVVLSFVLFLPGCGDQPIDLGTADVVGTWGASWSPLSGTAPGNAWTCTQTDATTLTVTASTSGGLGGTVSSLIMHCVGPGDMEFDGEFGNTNLAEMSLGGTHVSFRLGPGQLSQEGEVQLGSMSGSANWTFTTPAHYVDGVLTTQAIVSGTWSATKEQAP